MAGRRAYIDSSVVLRRLLRHPDALSVFAKWDLGASDLMEVEALRTLYRAHSQGGLSDDDLRERIADLRAIVAALEQFPITKAVLLRASRPLPGNLKALDAIHLASALLWSEYCEERIVMITHDRQLAKVSRASGLEVYPPDMP